MKVGLYDLQYIGFLILGLAFLTQPINIRLYGYSYPLIIMLLIFVVCVIYGRKKIGAIRLIILIPIVFILLVYDFILNDAFRGLVFLFLLVFVVVFSDVIIENKDLKRLWGVVGYVTLFLAIIGFYRYMFGHNVVDSENVDGFAGIFNKYRYLGISYMKATRNSEALYFGVGAVFFRWRVEGRSLKFSDAIGLYVLLCAVVLSLSRGIWIATLFAYLFAFDLKKTLWLLAPIAVFLLIYVTVYDSFVGSLLVNGIISFFDPSTASANVYGFYGYSNEVRIEIYKYALQDIIANPFGYGISYVPSYALFSGAKSVHSENLFLDILLVLGIFSVPFIYYLLKIINRVYLLEKSNEKKLIKGVFILILLFAMFNGGMDVAFLWYVLALLIITINSSYADCCERVKLNVL